MFDLSDTIREEIVFAMENQEIEYAIDVDSGEIVATELDYEADEPDSKRELVDPPYWSSGDGFRLMDSFTRAVGDPEGRNALLAALGRGRGVFRAFKNSLAMYPEIERLWYAYKDAAMIRRVNEWYDQLRVARGLESLGPEPEDTDDLLAGEFSLRRCGRDYWPQCRELFSRGLSEALDKFPEALVEYEYTAIDKEIEGGADGDLVLFVVEAAAGALVAVAVARKVFIADRSFGKLVYLYVLPEQRRLGLGRLLAERAREDFAAEGVARFIVDLAFLPDGFGKSLNAYGYESFGTRWIRNPD
jgi:GNAT superfamily N-acetyltransferase